MIGLCPSGGGRCADIAPAMKFRSPRAAGAGFAIHTGELVQIIIAYSGRREPAQYIAKSAGHGCRTMERQIGLRRQISHDKGDQIGGRFRAIIQSDDAVAINILGNFLPSGIMLHMVDEIAFSVIRHQRRPSMSIGINGLAIQRTANPGPEFHQFRVPALGFATLKPVEMALQILVDIEKIQAVGAFWNFSVDLAHRKGPPIADSGISLEHKMNERIARPL
ncbi:hypothetical protein MnTg02_01826 [bacterium MnTg02]|nr:hypothetical protein MnTg02_01826 [bacterium MnTg02]